MATGVLMLDLEGYELTDEERVLLKDPHVGGLIIFSRNIQSRQQLKELVASIRSIKQDILIAIDQEGGRVQRLKDQVDILPPMAELGKLAGSSLEDGLQAARALGLIMASQLVDLDIDISFAPVLDLDYGRSGVIGDRAFASDPEMVAQLSAAFADGMRKAGMSATGKHFPGHGWVQADSHLDIPVDERALSEIEKNDLKPFQHLIDSGLEGIMPAHVVYTAVSDKEPAGFSSYWLQTVLRQQMRFDGVIFSDDLTMEGASIAGGYTSRANAALMAGCDMLLVCNNRPAALEVLEWLEVNNYSGSERIVKMLRNRVNVDVSEVEEARSWLKRLSAA